MPKLSVNLNKIALLRNQRNIGMPNVVEAARIVIDAGAHGITVHPRPDQRHIRYCDVHELKDMLTVEFNIEGNPFPKFVELVTGIRPDQCTLVPDSPEAITSDHGWNIRDNEGRLREVIRRFKDLGIRVSLFMDADSAEIELAKQISADRIELYTEPYATAFREHKNTDQIIELYVDAANKAKQAGLGLNAGHDLNLQNLAKFCSVVPDILEVSIGHALIADALKMGLATAVKEYLKVLSQT